MRNADKLIELLNKDEMASQRFFWSEKLKDEKEQLFLGIRENRVDVYYLGSRIAEIKENSGRIEYTLDKYYSDGVDKTLDFEAYSCLYPTIRQRAWEYAMGERQDKDDKRKHREKVCQQWIANQYNLHSDEWYFTDIEYIDTASKRDQNAARMDMVAVSRKTVNGKHKVALIELKVTASAFGGFKGYEEISKEQYESIIGNPNILLKMAPRNRKGVHYYKIKEAYHELKKDLYQKQYWNVKYGSGIVSHFVDFSRYLYEPQNYIRTLKKEIIKTIEVHKRFNLLDEKDILCNISESDLCDQPNIYIISYTKTPTMPNNDKNDVCDLSKLKEKMYYELFQSQYSLEKMLNGAQMKGILGIKELLKEIIDLSDKNKINLEHEVKGQKYDISLVFIDPDNMEDKWKCIE